MFVAKTAPFILFGEFAPANHISLSPSALVSNVPDMSYSLDVGMGRITFPGRVLVSES